MFTLLGVLGTQELVLILFTFLIYGIPVIIIILLFNRIRKIEKRLDDLENRNRI